MGASQRAWPARFVNWWCAEINVNVNIFDHDHFCSCEDGCVASITILSYRKERHVQIGDMMAFNNSWW